MKHFTTPLYRVGFATFKDDHGVIEIRLPEWSSWITQAEAVKVIADLRKFCDSADAALAQTDSRPT